VASSPRVRWRTAQGGVRPSSEAENRPRGRQALERGEDSHERASALEPGGDSTTRCPVLERDGDSPEGYHDRSFGGSFATSWAVGPSLIQVAAMQSAFAIHGLVCLRYGTDEAEAMETEPVPHAEDWRAKYLSWIDRGELPSDRFEARRIARKDKSFAAINASCTSALPLVSCSGASPSPTVVSSFETFMRACVATTRRRAPS
jgi:hypothetical protein